MINSAYSPGELEKKWYQKWIDARLFERKIDNHKEPYSIVIPPPNVTGILHMGHVLNSTIQDVLIRRAKQLNKSALWIPGTDHAGISLQIKVEKELQKKGINKNDLSREEFLKYAYEWRDSNGGIILEQLKKIGVSCDWTSLKHTLDEDYYRAVLSVFVKLYHSGYIYRGKRLVNWCPVSMTALSDEEVIMKQQSSKLYYVKYHFQDLPNEYVVVATTRPETIPADAAIAVNPNDERYKHLIGKNCWRPLEKKLIPIIADEAVLQDFGTGVLKVTPAHDIVDFEISQRHKLNFVSIMNKDGRLNELAGPDFDRMERFRAREKAVYLLKNQGDLVQIEDYMNNIGISERSGVPVEPMISEQWFLRYPKVEEAKIAIKEKIIKFVPERWTKTYMHWLDNIKDWCISRQLYWGHRIPVWYKKNSDRSDHENVHVSIDGPNDPENWEQDSDVLDTWFSSAIWPLATLGWPDENKMKESGFSYFYPTTDLVTGPDIIFFWVARMIMSGLNLLDDNVTNSDKSNDKSISDDDDNRGTEINNSDNLSIDEIKCRIPFKNVYFTGIIRDNLGRKMSKSLGNSPDPLILIDRFGADGVRLGLMLMAPEGQDILFSEERLSQGKKLCTKLWNSVRFRQMRGEIKNNDSLEKICERIDVEDLDITDCAILGELVSVMYQYQSALDAYEFNRAAQLLYNFFWGYYCDWYIEVSKSKNSATGLAIHDLVLRYILQLLFPFIPFITEELWHSQQYSSDFLEREIILAPCELCTLLEKFNIKYTEGQRTEVNKIRELVSSIRAQKAQFGLAAVKNLKFYYQVDDVFAVKIQEYKKIIQYLLHTDHFERTNTVLQMPVCVTDIATVYMDVNGERNVNKERPRIIDEMERVLSLIEINRKKLANDNFIKRAPTEVVEGARKLLRENEEKYKQLEIALNNIALW